MRSTFLLCPIGACAGRTRRVLGGAMLAAAALMTGCSSSAPSSSDIERAWNEAYGCPTLEIRDFKKLDGKPGPQGSYEADFSYSVAIKGGEAAAGKLLTDYLYVQSEQGAVKQALLMRLDKPASDPQVVALKAYASQLTSRLEQLSACNSPDFAAMLEITEQAINANSPSIAVPVAAKVSRSNAMEKSESGWHLNMMVAVLHSFDVQSSKPMQFAKPPSKVPELLGSGSAAAPAGEQRLVGTIHRGATDSCLAVVEAGAEKCYGLPSDPAQAQRIFGACADGDECAITGLFDHKAESLGAFSKVEKVSR